MVRGGVRWRFPRVAAWVIRPMIGAILLHCRRRYRFALPRDPALKDLPHARSGTKVVRLPARISERCRKRLSGVPVAAPFAKDPCGELSALSAFVFMCTMAVAGCGFDGCRDRRIFTSMGASALPRLGANACENTPVLAAIKPAASDRHSVHKDKRTQCGKLPARVFRERGGNWHPAQPLATTLRDSRW